MKKTINKTKTISLGDIHMESYKKGGRLFPDYYYDKSEDESGKHEEEIKQNPPEEIILSANQECQQHLP